MKTTLVTFGDSWTWGADLLPGEKTYGQLIAEARGWEFQNFAEISTAPEHMVLQLQHMINIMPVDVDVEYVALFSFTALTRFMYYPDKPRFDFQYGTECGYVMHDGSTEGDNASDSYYKYIHSDRLDHFKFYTTALSLLNLCQQNNIRDYYALSFSNVDWQIQDYRGIDRHKFWDRGDTNFLNLFGCKWVDNENKYFAGTASSHPNQLGHELIAAHLSEWIK